jgi:hypothetical protein
MVPIPINTEVIEYDDVIHQVQFHLVCDKYVKNKRFRLKKTIDHYAEWSSVTLEYFDPRGRLVFGTSANRYDPEIPDLLEDNTPLLEREDAAECIQRHAKAWLRRRHDRIKLALMRSLHTHSYELTDPLEIVFRFAKL